MNNFKIGDRVRMKGYNPRVQKNDVGTVKQIFEICVGIEWDNLTNGHNGMGLYSGRMRHCWNVFKWDLELVPAEDKQVREVKRKAEVGEYVKIINANCVPQNEDGTPSYKNGDIVKIISDADCFGSTVRYRKGHDKYTTEYVLSKAEYVVLENYTPQVIEVKRKAKVGEYVKIVNMVGDEIGAYRNGDICECVQHLSGFRKQGIYVRTPGTHPCNIGDYTSFLYDEEYVVLENYSPTKEPEKTYTQAEVNELIKQTKADMLAKVQELLKEDKQC